MGSSLLFFDSILRVVGVEGPSNRLPDIFVLGGVSVLQQIFGGHGENRPAPAVNASLTVVSPRPEAAFGALSNLAADNAEPPNISLLARATRTASWRVSASPIADGDDNEILTVVLLNCVNARSRGAVVRRLANVGNPKPMSTVGNEKSAVAEKARGLSVCC